MPTPAAVINIQYFPTSHKDDLCSTASAAHWLRLRSASGGAASLQRLSQDIYKKNNSMIQWVSDLTVAATLRHRCPKYTNNWPYQGPECVHVREVDRQRKAQRNSAVFPDRHQSVSLLLAGCLRAEWEELRLKQLLRSVMFCSEIRVIFSRTYHL